MSNVFCLTSKSETWGLAINEAMASSRPVIVSNKVGCAADMVSIGKNGFIFNYSEVSELVEIIENLTFEKLNAMKPEAYKKALQFNFLNIVTAIEHELDEV